MKNYSVIIIGGGASGLAAAAFFAKCGFNKVALFERSERVGRKLSASGNGQGNVTNLNMGAEHYFADDKEKVKNILYDFDNAALLKFLESLGGFFVSDEKGRVYPSSKQASSITDILRSYISYMGIDVLTDNFVSSVRYEKGKFAVTSSSGEYSSDKVMLCGGGKAQKNFGSDGNSYEIAKSFSHTVTPLYPSLVQIKTDTAHIKTLKGIRADAVLSANIGGRLIKSRGDVIFTDYGISGNAAFYLSSYLAGAEGAEINVEFLPDVSKEKLISGIENKMRERPDIDRNELLCCVLNNQIGRSVLKRCSSFTAEEIAKKIKNFTLEYKGTLGFDYAQVTRGGVPLKEVSSSLESLKCKGLYMCGEMLNVDGECGGYNIQWAFSSAYAACKNILNGRIS